METHTSNGRAKARQLLPLVPGILFVILIFQIALAIMLVTAFFGFKFPRIIQEFTLENFQQVFSSSLYLGILYVTLKIAVVTTLLSLLLGYPIGYALARSRSGYMRTVLFGGVLVSLFVGIIERVYAWMILLRDTGVINRSLAYLGIGPFHLMYNELGIIIASTHFLLPYSILCLMGSIQSVGSSIEEAALSLGASRVRVFVDITLPLSLPGILSSVLLTFSLGVSAFIVPMLLGGGVVWMLSNMIYDRVINALDLPLGASLALVLLVLAVVVTQVVTVLLSRKIKVR